MRSIVLHTQPSEKSGVVIENNEVTEYVNIRPEVNTLSGSIFSGKVESIHKGMQAAFIDFGQKKNGFLKREEIPWCTNKIEQALKEGEEIKVQVIKEPLDQKGAQLTADITIPGLLCVYQPYGEKISISRKIIEPLRTIFLNQTTEWLEETEGAIIRTAAKEVSQDELQEELASLKRHWKSLAAGTGHTLWLDAIVPDQLIRKYPIMNVDHIYVDDTTISQYLKKRYPSLKEKITWKKELDSVLPSTINEIQSQLIQRYLPIEQGIELVIDETEAMTVIDVNSAGYQGKTLSNSQSFEVNKRAAKEAARQLKLRNIAGMIVIDFISMHDTSLEKKLIQYMKMLVKNDLIYTNILGITRLGLMEITRKRQWTSPGISLKETYSPSFKDSTWLFRMERDLLLKRTTSSEAILVVVNPRLYDEKKRLLSSLISSKIPQELFVREDPMIHGYQIELEGSRDMVLEAVKRREYHVDNLF